MMYTGTDVALLVREHRVLNRGTGYWIRTHSFVKGHRGLKRRILNDLRKMRTGELDRGPGCWTGAQAAGQGQRLLDRGTGCWTRAQVAVQRNMLMDRGTACWTGAQAV